MARFRPDWIHIAVLHRSIDAPPQNSDFRICMPAWRWFGAWEGMGLRYDNGAPS
jgi:hypothetical protein